MAKKLKGDQVLTGQLLREGDVVFYAEDGSWSSDLQKAKVATTPEQIDELDLFIAQAEEVNLVIDIYPIVVEKDEAGQLVPSLIREKMRTTGPSIVYADF